MSWSIVLENEKGDLISLLKEEFSHESLFDEDKRKSFRLLKYLDPYGDLIFNSLQMDDLFYDIRFLMSLGYDKIVCDELLQISDQCKNNNHLYLKFCGN